MPEMPRTQTAALHREEDWYIAQCLEIDVASQRHSLDEAHPNLAEVAGIYPRIGQPDGQIVQRRGHVVGNVRLSAGRISPVLDNLLTGGGRGKCGEPHAPVL